MPMRRTLVALAVLLGWAVVRPLPAESPPPATLRVSGDARVPARPDRVQIDVGVVTPAAKSQEAATQNARDLDTVLAALRKAAGPGAVLKTVSYSLTPTYQYHKGGEPPTITGYTAVNVVQVQLDELGRMGAVIDSATEAGANRVQ